VRGIPAAVATWTVLSATRDEVHASRATKEPPFDYSTWGNRSNLTPAGRLRASAISGVQAPGASCLLCFCRTTRRSRSPGVSGVAGPLCRPPGLAMDALQPRLEGTLAMQAPPDPRQGAALLVLDRVYPSTHVGFRGWCNHNSRGGRAGPGFHLLPNPPAHLPAADLLSLRSGSCKSTESPGPFRMEAHAARLDPCAIQPQYRSRCGIQNHIGTADYSNFQM